MFPRTRCHNTGSNGWPETEEFPHAARHSLQSGCVAVAAADRVADARAIQSRRRTDSPPLHATSIVAALLPAQGLLVSRPEARAGDEAIFSAGVAPRRYRGRGRRAHWLFDHVGFRGGGKGGGRGCFCNWGEQPG